MPWLEIKWKETLDYIYTMSLSMVLNTCKIACLFFQNFGKLIAGWNFV